MPTASTAVTNNICPICGKHLKQPRHTSTRHVGHMQPPDVEAILSNPAKVAMLTKDEVEFPKKTRYCPFERGQKDAA